MLHLHNVSMMLLPPIYRKYAYQWRVSQVVFVYGLHRLDAWSCQECWRQPASGASASTVPQSGTACRLLSRRQSFTEHVFAAAEGLSVWTVMQTTRRRCGVLWLWRHLEMSWLTYLLTYSHLPSHRASPAFGQYQTIVLGGRDTTFPESFVCSGTAFGQT